MKKGLLSILLIASLGQLNAKIFTAFGIEPYWSIDLKSQGNSDIYQATFSHPSEKGIEYIEGRLRKVSSSGLQFKGATTAGESFIMNVYSERCTDYASDDDYPTRVTVRIGDWRFDGCSRERFEQKKHRDPVNNARAKARKLNTRGYHLYKQGKYKKALLLFNQARKADNSYDKGHYNFACTASIIAHRNQCLQSEKLQQLVTLDNVLRALKRSIKITPQRKAKSQTDPDLATLRSTYQYYRDILHYSPNNDRQLREMLRKLKWTQAFGFYPHHGVRARIEFDDYYVTTTANSGQQQTGNYQIYNGLITLTFGGKTATGRLVEDSNFGAVLRFTGDGLPFDEFSVSTKFDMLDCEEE
ncbi:hypothetical protein QJU83_04500 [Pasteurella skyensis]|uniref:hypothetical protein n=1 Tax=Phocoenobacter skyensis TaxID=97481 RepID=UPI00274D2021|nr:hypothetical protein [Pasteurella skyensis]MDP8176801.1 hypothetical protein [Pasteurella skyensis]MDP8199400.1 hypothetical protein [Pasteurella skyensis]